MPKYARPTSSGQKKEKKISFEPGSYEAVIKNVYLEKTKTKKKKLVLQIAGDEGQIGYYHLVFDTPYTENNMNCILALIEDNGEEIPDMDFDYNQKTADFLKEKAVYILVEEEDWQGEVKPAITSFLQEEEYLDEQGYTED